ncbi:MAG: 16S rRNA (uracil(1498)-N(3))-methyltransferase [Desulfurivibrio sp.]|nr:16S rRNA (uracil(1498)-N(3))-methyltransferase [Desulfurivibrio sp.]
MNLILIDPGEIQDSRVLLTDQRARHIRKILRSQVGDHLRLGIIGGSLGQGLVLHLDRDTVLLELHCSTPPPAKAATDLILALPRPIMLNRVLAQATAMGVGRIMLINAERVEKSFWQSSQLRTERLQAALWQGLAQAMDTQPPVLTLHRRFRPFVEDELPPLTTHYPRRLLAHPAPAVTAADAPAPGRQLLTIGPEGGWRDSEITAFTSQGFQFFSLGPRILRVDTAVPALLAAAGR